MSLKALVVDDSMLIRHTVCRYLEERGFTVETATNGQEALEALKSLRPDLIITDMQMPKMSGTEFITALKNNVETVNIPIVLVAGKHGESIKKEQRADLKIFKDIEIEEQLANALDTVLGTQGAKGQAVGK
jgi:CheY-like chemotaxis protein